MRYRWSQPLLGSWHTSRMSCAVADGSQSRMVQPAEGVRSDILEIGPIWRHAIHDRQNCARCLVGRYDSPGQIVRSRSHLLAPNDNDLRDKAGKGCSSPRRMQAKSRRQGEPRRPWLARGDGLKMLTFLLSCLFLRAQERARNRGRG